MSEFKDQMTEFFGKGITKAIMVIFVLVLIWTITSAIFSFWPFSSIAGVVKKVTTPEAIIGNYEWFYDQKEAIVATKRKYSIALKAEMEEAPGIAMVLEGMIAEYNSKSKQITRNLWKADDLPYQIRFEEVE